MKKNNNLDKIFIYLIIIFFIFLIIHFIYKQSIKKEEFLNNPNYCRSSNGTFIYITNPNDTRCLRNNKNINSNKIHISGKGNCLKNNTWGLWYNNTCLTFNNIFNKFYGMNYNDLLKQKYLDYLSSEEEDNEKNILFNKLKEKRQKMQRKKTCNDLKKRNSTPCFELFENETTSTCSIDQLNKYQKAIDDSKDTDNQINLDKECKDDKGIGFGYYSTDCFNSTYTNNCRKYYKSNNNQVISPDSVPLLGTYDPESYFFVPKKNDDTINMTGCYEKSLDFNSICASVNNNQLYGALKILNGEKGNCYDDNGEPDPTKSNAFCSQNFYNERPIVLVQNGYSTKCLPLYSNFTNECKKIIKNNEDYNIKAFDINSYDCPPNRGRAKCLLQNKKK